MYRIFFRGCKSKGTAETKNLDYLKTSLYVPEPYEERQDSPCLFAFWCRRGSIAEQVSGTWQPDGRQWKIHGSNADDYTIVLFSSLLLIKVKDPALQFLKGNHVVNFALHLTASFS